MSKYPSRHRRLIVSLVISCLVIAAVMLGAATRAEFDPAAIFLPTLTATKSDTSLSGDGDGKADPGEVINYSVQVTNAGPDPATGVTFSDTIDANTTLQGAFTAASAVAVNDTFPTTVLGNVSINSATITGGPYSVVTNDFLGVNPLSTISAFDAISANGGNIVMTTSGGAMGQFTYDPPAGFTGTDTFTYTLTDNASATSVAANRTATVSITVSGMVWFINNNAAACTSAGCGRLSNPFSTLAAFNTLNNGTGNNPAAGDNIFVYESATTYTGGVTLLANQRFIGQDSQDTFSNITGLTPPTGSPAFPAMNLGGSATTITNAAGNGIQLNDGNTIRGLIVSGASAAGIAGAGLTNTAIIAGNNDVTITGTTGLNVGDGALSLNGGNGAITFSGTITGNTGLAVNIRNRTGGITTIQGPVTSTTRGINLDNNDGATILFTAGMSLSTGANPAFTAINGGTVVATQNNTSVVNTLTTSTGTALTVTGTTIGASGITFRSISANGAASGIILNTTGSSGGVTVTGNGSACSSAVNCSGGAIQNTTGTGVLLTSTGNVSLTRMFIGNTGLHGVAATGMSQIGAGPTFEIRNSYVSSPGDADSEAAFNFGYSGTPANNSGIFTFADTVIENFEDFGITAANSTGSMTLNITGTLSGTTPNFDSTMKFVDNHDTHGESAIVMIGTGTAAIYLNVSGTYFNNVEGSGVLYQPQGASTNDVNVTNSAFNNGGGPDNFPNPAYVVINSVDQNTVRFDVQNNDMLDAREGIVVVGDGHVMGRIGGSSPALGNRITGVAFDAVRLDMDGIFGSVVNSANFTWTVLIQNNILSGAAGNANLDDAIQVLNRDHIGTMNLTVENNAISDFSSEAFRYFGAERGTPPQGDTNALVRFANNTLSNTAFGVGELDLIQRTTDSAVACFDITGNINSAGPFTIDFDESETSIQGVTQVSLAAVSAANGGATVTNSVGAVAFSASCTPTLPSNPMPPPVEEIAIGDTYQRSIDLHNAQVSESRSAHVGKGEAIVAKSVSRETGFFQSMSNFANRIFSIISPTASAQEGRVVNGAKVRAPESGETVNIGPINTLPAGKSVTITFSVTVDALGSGEIRTRILNQGSADSNETSAVLTTDPSPSVDPACTAAPSIGTKTCTPVDRPDATITSIARSSGFNPTNNDNVQWTIMFSTPVAGVDQPNFNYVTTGGVTAAWGGATPQGGTPSVEWSIGANTIAGDGTIDLRMINDGGMSHDITTALPYVQPANAATFTIDNTPPSTTSFVRQTPASNPTNADTLVFRATFSEAVTEIAANDFVVTGTTATITGFAGVGGGPNFTQYDLTVSGGDLAGLNGVVGLNFIPAAPAGFIKDLAGNNLPSTEPGTDETYTLDNAPPTVTINQAGGQVDPTNTSPISFTVAFNEAVTDFDDLADVTLTGTATATVTSITPAGGNTFTVVVTPTTNGTVIANIGSGVAIDGAGNPNAVATFTDNQVTYDTAAPTVTINQAIGQSDPTFANPINFTAVFNEPVTDFDDATDVTVTGTAAGVGTATVVITPNSTTNYTVAISGITGDGTVIANIPAGVAIDAASNSNVAATFTDNTVTFVTCVAPPPNMKAWYSGDTTLRDIAGGYDASSGGSPATTYAAGKVGNAFDLNGTSQYIERVDTTGMDTNASAFSFDAWIFREGKLNPTAHEGLIVKMESSPLSADAFGVFIQDTGTVGPTQDSFFITYGGSLFTTPLGSVPAVNTWFHYAQTYDGANIRVYVNGALMFTQPYVGRAASTGPLYLGGRAAQHPFNGRIDEVEVFNGVLSPADITLIFNADGGGKCKPSDLRVDKSHVGNFTQGTAGSFSVVVSNDGPAATSGTTTMTDTLPVGLTPGAATGTNWSCNTVTQTVTCTSTDAIPAAGSFPTITIPVTVAQNSALSLNNTATVSGGGEMDTTDDSDTDPTTIVGVAQTPSVTGASTVHGAQTTSGLVITPNATDGAEVTHFKITNIQNGSLFLNDGTTPVTAGSFITVAQGGAGLKFTPNLGFVGNATFDIQASISNSDAGLGGSVITATIVVNQANTVPTITSDSPDPSVFGGNVVVNFTVVPQAPGAGVPSGNVMVTVSGGAETCTGTVASGTCTLALTAVGPRTLTATYAGDTFFTGSSDTEAHQVDQAATTTTITADNPDPSVTGQAVTVSFTVAANAPGAGTPTGNVNVTVSGGAETCTGTVAAGSCMITLTSAGARTLTATYVGDTNFTGSSDTEAHQVNQAATTTTTLSDSPDASVVGQPVAVAFTVVANPPGSGTPTGNVVVTVSGGAETCTGTVASGTCNITLTSAGARTLTATYSGDANFLTSFDTEPHQVDQASTSITGITDVPDPTNIDQPYTVSWTLNVLAPGAGTPTGTVSVSDGTGDTCTAILPANSCQLQSLTQGIKTITVTYNGDANFAASSNTAGHQVLCTPNPVVTNNNNSGAGSLRKAVADACSTAGQNTITFAAGPIPGEDRAREVPTVTSPISLSSGQITLDKNVIIQGPGAGQLTVQNTQTAGPTSRVFLVNGGVTASISGLTLTGGNPTGDGGGINNFGTLTLTNMVIAGNTVSATPNGGGGIISWGTLTLRSSTVSNNSTPAGNGGGGLLIVNGGTTIIEASTFSGNSSGGGGAILSQSITLPSSITIVNSTISGNTATPCPGLWNLGANATASVSSSTITNNNGGGGGICGAGSTTTVRSTIVAANQNNTTVPDVSGAFTSQGFNLIGNVGTATGLTQPTDQTGMGASPLDPQIGALANNSGPTQTHALLASSPAVDKGINAVVPLTTDQRGESRPFDIPSIPPAAGGDETDIGAYELNTIPTTLALASSANPSVFGQNVTFTATVATVPPGGTVTGNVDFAIDGNPVAACQNVVLAANQATCSISTLSVGAHTVFADFDENLPFLASSNTLTQNVNKANTTTTVTASPVSPSVFGQSVTFTATVAVVPPGAGSPTGTVSFNIDGNLYCVNTPINGSFQATCTQAGLPALPAGVRNVVAIYSGNASFNGSAGTLNYTVNKANTTTVITNDTPDPSLVNQPYTVTWTVTAVAPGAGTPTGTVTVNGGTGGGSCTASVAAGGCQLTPTTIGVKTISATYNGDNNFNTSTSSTTTHTVNVQITGTVRNGLTLAPVSGVTMNLVGCASGSGTTTTNASGVYSFTGQIVGPCRVYPNPVSEPYERVYATVLTNITNADFLIYANPADHPRRVTYPTQFVVPGAAGSMPVIMNSLGNEATVAFSFTYDINPFSQPPVVVCGANAPGCTITQNNTVFGKVGVTIAPVGGVFTRPDGTPLDEAEAAGPNEIARINFQTVASTTLPSTDFVLGNTPTTVALTETGTGNPLYANFIEPARIVFAHGIEADVAGRNAGSGAVDASDVTQVKRFVTGLDTPVGTHNEFQRADTAPVSTKGNGQLDATDVIQTRRFASGLDGAQSAGGPGLAAPVMAPEAERPESGAKADGETKADGRQREISLGNAQASTNSRVSIPVSLAAGGDEMAVSFTVRYDETRLTNPQVALTANAAEGTNLTFNAEEPGVIRVLIDGTSPLASREAREAIELLSITFDVTQTAPTGETELTIEDGTISDARANALTARYTAGRISISGPNPTDEKGTRPTRRTQRPEEFDIIQEWTRANPISILRRREP